MRLMDCGALVNSRKARGYFGRNDLEPVVYRRFPEVSRAAQWLSGTVHAPGTQEKKRGLDVRMSGSGACLFAEFDTIETAVLAQHEIAATMRVAGLTSTSQATQESPPRFRLLQACPGLAEHPLRHWIAS